MPDRTPEQQRGLEPAQSVPLDTAGRDIERWNVRRFISVGARLNFWALVGGVLSYLGYGVTQEQNWLVPFSDYLRNNQHQMWTAVGMPIGLGFGTALELRSIARRMRVSRESISLDNSPAS